MPIFNSYFDLSVAEWFMQPYTGEKLMEAQIVRGSRLSNAVGQIE